MKLTKEQIEEIKFFREEGKRLVELARMYGVDSVTIKYHCEPDFKKKRNKYYAERFRNLPKKKKKEIYEKNKKYFREYMKKYYHRRKANL